MLSEALQLDPATQGPVASNLRITTDAHVRALRQTYAAIAVQDQGPVIGTLAGGLHLGVDYLAPHDIDEAVRETDRLLARRAAIRHGTRVLDSGCGIGGSSVWLAAELGAVVTGVTLLDDHAEQARERARAAGVDLRIVVADYLRTGLAAGTFDVIWQIESLCHCTDLDAYLRNAHTLLAPDGRFAAIDVFVGDGGAEVWEGLRRTVAFGEPCTMDGLAARLEASGFVDVVMEDLTPRVIAFARLWRNLALLGEALSRTPPTARSDITRGNLDFAAGLESGALRYGLVVAQRR
jgi:SAM-dependent methyltransferase